MERLGGSVIPINEVRYSSVSKGESLPDTVRTLEAFPTPQVLQALTRFAAGDKLKLQLTPYDLSTGRIVLKAAGKTEMNLD